MGRREWWRRGIGPASESNPQKSLHAWGTIQFRPAERLYTGSRRSIRWTGNAAVRSLVARSNPPLPPACGRTARLFLDDLSREARDVDESSAARTAVPASQGNHKRLLHVSSWRFRLSGINIHPERYGDRARMRA